MSTQMRTAQERGYLRQDKRGSEETLNYFCADFQGPDPGQLGITSPRWGPRRVGRRAWEPRASRVPTPASPPARHPPPRRCGWRAPRLTLQLGRRLAIGLKIAAPARRPAGRGRGRASPARADPQPARQLRPGPALPLCSAPPQARCAPRPCSAGAPCSAYRAAAAGRWLQGTWASYWCLICPRSACPGRGTASTRTSAPSPTTPR